MTDVTTVDQLNAAILAADDTPTPGASGTTTVTITLDNNIYLGTTALEAINLNPGVTLVINSQGNNTYTLYGGTFDSATGTDSGQIERGLFVYAGTVDVTNLAIDDMRAQGGSGVSGGGGGAGLGGGLFIGANRAGDAGNVTLSNVTFANDEAVGGSGGVLGHDVGGGGGLGGNGGSGFVGGLSVLPVCFKAGALGDNVPARELWVSPNHAMYFQGDHPSGVLIEAKDLVNGVSIVQAHSVEKVEYFHIELDSHDVIIAEGALSESFIDDDSRAMFHNAHDYDTLYADEVRRPASYCAPRLDEGYQLEAVRRRLTQRAGMLCSADTPRTGAVRGYIDRVRTSRIFGWAQNIDAPEAPVCLDIYAAGKFIGRVLANAYRDDLKAADLGSGRHGFEFAAPAGVEFAAETIEVRRALDGAPLGRSGPASFPPLEFTMHRRAARM